MVRVVGRGRLFRFSANYAIYDLGLPRVHHIRSTNPPCGQGFGQERAYGHGTRVIFVNGRSMARLLSGVN
jgi:hypothetical protein